MQLQATPSQSRLQRLHLKQYYVSSFCHYFQQFSSALFSALLVKKISPLQPEDLFFMLIYPKCKVDRNTPDSSVEEEVKAGDIGHLNSRFVDL